MAVTFHLSPRKNEFLNFKPVPYRDVYDTVIIKAICRKNSEKYLKIKGYIVTQRSMTRHMALLAHCNSYMKNVTFS